MGKSKKLSSKTKLGLVFGIPLPFALLTLYLFRKLEPKEYLSLSLAVYVILVLAIAGSIYYVK